MTVNNRRQGNKWTINELISLQREYELLELTVKQIADKHQRSETAILYRLESEGLIDSWNSARGFVSEDYQNSVSSNKEQVQAEYDEAEEQEVGGDDNDEEYQFVDEAESDDDDISDDESEVEKLTERVWSLETSVGEISSIVKNIYSMLYAKQSSKKRKPLRNASTTTA
jgi:hypothetical protein